MHTKYLRTNSTEHPNAPIRILFLVRVEGESLWPELVPGKRYLATSLFKPNAGDYIVFKNPKNQREIFVKKVKKIIGDSYEVGGTVPWSSSSEEFGLVPNELVLGKIILPGLFPITRLQKQKLPTMWQLLQSRLEMPGVKPGGWTQLRPKDRRDIVLP